MERTKSVNDNYNTSEFQEEEKIYFSRGRGPGLAAAATMAKPKKSRVEWTTELHRKFVDAFEILQLRALQDPEIVVGPENIRKLMNEPQLTRVNVASHLQKYRKNLKKQSKAKEISLPRESMAMGNDGYNSHTNHSFQYTPTFSHISHLHQNHLQRHNQNLLPPFPDVYQRHSQPSNVVSQPCVSNIGGNEYRLIENFPNQSSSIFPSQPTWQIGSFPSCCLPDYGRRNLGIINDLRSSASNLWSNNTTITNPLMTNMRDHSDTFKRNLQIFSAGSVPSYSNNDNERRYDDSHEEIQSLLGPSYDDETPSLQRYLRQL